MLSVDVMLDRNPVDARAPDSYAIIARGKSGYEKRTLQLSSSSCYSSEDARSDANFLGLESKNQERKLKLQQSLHDVSISELAMLHHQEQQHGAAAGCIQRAFRRHMDKRNGKLLLQRYRVLFQQELRRKEQRMVIHRYLLERQEAREKRRNRRQPQAAPGSRSSDTSSWLPFTPTATPTMTSASAFTSPSTSSSFTPVSMPPTPAPSAAPVTDDPDVVRCWSDEYQCHYLYNARTGESTWLTDN
ncbi:hypothetical protein ATCC90586_008778 [Pythium insidiosum]|nr:hypothetical protein ATCC90586_008778 [Pythium insidiosum]